MKNRIERIATDKVTGRRFLVSRIDIPKKGPQTVFLKQIIAAKEQAGHIQLTTLKGIMKMPRVSVDIEEMVLTWDLVQEMWREYHESKGGSVVMKANGSGRAVS